MTNDVVDLNKRREQKNRAIKARKLVESSDVLDAALVTILAENKCTNLTASIAVFKVARLVATLDQETASTLTDHLCVLLRKQVEAGMRSKADNAGMANNAQTETDDAS